MKYDPVAEALKRRKDAGVCLICGGKLVKPRLRKAEPRCENADDMRHKQPLPPRFKVKPLTEQQKRVKLKEPPHPEEPLK